MNGEFHSKMDTIRAFLSKIRILFFRFSKKAGESSPLLLSCVPVSVADYASISLNMPENPWKCLNKLFWLCQDSEHAWSSYMFDRLLEMPVLNKQGSEYGTFVYARDTQICRFPNMPEYASICLNVHQYALAKLNIAECPWYVWINLFDYARVLNMTQCSYNNIIIVTTLLY